MITRILTLSVLFALAALTSFAQVPRKVLVEHFTNTRCGICGSRNPSFISYINTRSDILHMSVHPSRPYNTCVLNNHNMMENDDRTKFYSGVYGSTPRIVVAGTVIPANVNYADMGTYAPHTGATSPVSISIDPIQYSQSTDSFNIRVVLHTVATHSLGNLSLFVALTEDTVFYNAPNGESRHYNVFRKSASSTTGDAVMAATMVGDSMVYNFGVKNNSEWDFNRINATVILQETADKALVQAERQTAMDAGNVAPNGIAGSGEPMQSIRVYPNPLTGNILHLENTTELYDLQILTLNGEVILQQSGNREIVELDEVKPGAYILYMEDAEHGPQTRLLIRN